MTDLLIGLDLGTSATKGILISADGQLMAQESCPTNLIRPKPGHVEFSSEAHYTSVCELIQSLAEKIPQGGFVKAIGVSGASGNTVLLDNDGHPLMNAISWMDKRAGDDFTKLAPKLDPADIYRAAGWPWRGIMSLTHLAWLKKNKSDTFQAASLYGMNITYILYRLTGESALDFSTATTFYLVDQVKRHWNDSILDALGIQTSSLPKLMDSGSSLGALTKYASRETGLPEKTSVVLGAFDHPSAARGVGVFEKGQLLLSCGTSWVGLYPIDNRDLALSYDLLVDSFLQPKGPWAAMFSIPYIGSSIDKHVDTFFPSPNQGERYDRFNTEAQNAPLGANGLFLNPSDDPESPKVIEKTKSHSPSDIARAIMEGTAFKAKERMDALSKAGISYDAITMVGGPSESPIWPKILANVTGRPIRLLNGPVAGAMGAAILAGMGTGIFKDERHGFENIGGNARTINPEKSTVKQYEDLRREYACTE